MMKSFRSLFSVAVVLLLAAGYLGSQYFYFNRDENGANHASEWAARVDSPPVVWLALVVLIVAIVLSLIRETEGSS